MSTFSRFVKRTPSTTPTDNYRRRQLRRALREQALKGSLPTVDQIAHPENLMQVFQELKVNAGQAPGIDHVTYSDLSLPEVGSCMRGLSNVVLTGLYRPAPSLLVQIPKTSGKGHRTLALRAILDRVVSAALNKAMTPFWDKMFLPGIFRPRRIQLPVTRRKEQRDCQCRQNRNQPSRSSFRCQSRSRRNPRRQ